VRHKVIAFEEFLERHPEFQGQVVLIQVALSTTEQNQLQASITDVISHVNSRFGSLTYQPVVLLHTQDITFSMYLGLLTAADAFIVTSLREGMALRTHEFVECQHERKRPLLLSEVCPPQCLAATLDSHGICVIVHGILLVQRLQVVYCYQPMGLPQYGSGHPRGADHER